MLMNIVKRCRSLSCIKTRSAEHHYANEYCESVRYGGPTAWLAVGSDVAGLSSVYSLVYMHDVVNSIS